MNTLPVDILLLIIGNDARVWNKLVRAVPWIHKMIPSDVLREQFTNSTSCYNFLNVGLLHMSTLCGKIHTVGMQSFSKLSRRIPAASTSQTPPTFFNSDNINMSIHINYGALTDYNGAPAINTSIVHNDPFPWTRLMVHAKDGYPYYQGGPAVVYSTAVDDSSEITNGDSEDLVEGYENEQVLFEIMEIYADELPGARHELDPNFLAVNIDARSTIEFDDPKVAEFVKNVRIKKFRNLDIRRYIGRLIDLDVDANQVTIKTFNIQNRKTYTFDHPHTIDAELDAFNTETDVTKMSKTAATELITQFALGWLNCDVYGSIDNVIETIDMFYPLT